MTDENIMKALGHCSHDYCRECPYKDDARCITNMSKDALDLIHRQKDEIEGLTVGQETLQKHILQLNKELEREKTKVEFLERANSELYNTNRLLNQQAAESFMDSVNAGTKAIRKFVEAFKVKFAKERYRDNYVIDDEMLDNFTKEVVGEN